MANPNTHEHANVNQQVNNKFIPSLNKCIVDGKFNDPEIEKLANMLSADTEASDELLCNIAKTATNILSGDKTPEKEIAAQILANHLVRRLSLNILEGISTGNGGKALSSLPDIGKVSSVGSKVLENLVTNESMAWLRSLTEGGKIENVEKKTTHMDSVLVNQAHAFNGAAKQICESLNNNTLINNFIDACLNLGTLNYYSACSAAKSFAEAIKAEMSAGSTAEANKDTEGAAWSFNEIYEAENNAEVFKTAIKNYIKELQTNLVVPGRKEDVVKGIVSDYSGATVLFSKAIAKFDGDTPSIGLKKADPDSSDGFSKIVLKAISEICADAKPEAEHSTPEEEEKEPVEEKPEQSPDQTNTTD